MTEALRLYTVTSQASPQGRREVMAVIVATDPLNAVCKAVELYRDAGYDLLLPYLDTWRAKLHRLSRENPHITSKSDK